MRRLVPIAALIVPALVGVARADDAVPAEARETMRAALVEQLRLPAPPARLPVLGVDPLPALRDAGSTRLPRPGAAGERPGPGREGGRPKLREVVDRAATRDTAREQHPGPPGGGRGRGRGERGEDRPDRASPRDGDGRSQPPPDDRRDGDGPARR